MTKKDIINFFSDERSGLMSIDEIESAEDTIRIMFGNDYFIEKHLSEKEKWMPGDYLYLYINNFSDLSEAVRKLKEPDYYLARKEDADNAPCILLYRFE